MDYASKMRHELSFLRIQNQKIKQSYLRIKVKSVYLKAERKQEKTIFLEFFLNKNESIKHE
jgi:hypothetical protein